MCQYFLTGTCQNTSASCRFEHLIQRSVELPMDPTGRAKVAVSAVTIVPDPHKLICCAYGNQVLVYDEALTPKFPLPVEGPIDALDSTASGWLFASYFAPVAGKTSMEVGRINAWNVSTGATIELKSPGLEHAHRLQVTALDTAELHGRTVLFTGSLDGTIRVWSYDAASAQFQFHNTLEGHIRGVTALCWHEEMSVLFSGGEDHMIKAWQPFENKCIHTIMPPAGAAGAGPGGLAAALAAVHAAPAGGGDGHSDTIVSISDLHFQGQSILVTAAADGSIKAWGLGADFKVLLSVAPSPGRDRARKLTAFVAAVPEAFPDEAVVVAGFSDGTIELRELSALDKLAGTFGGHIGPRGVGHHGTVRTLVAVDCTIFAGGDDGKMSVWGLNVEPEEGALAPAGYAAAPPGAYGYAAAPPGAYGVPAAAPAAAFGAFGGGIGTL